MIKLQIQINKSTNSIEELKESSFSALSFNERDHLQEWIAKNPESLGEELLIIQKEYSKFGGTAERLDLLALDKESNLVVYKIVKKNKNKVFCFE